MKTAVIQAYQILPPSRSAPAWVARCLESVRSWATLSGFDYEFVSDGFLDLAPRWIIERCGAQIYPVLDLARLYLLKTYLERGYDRVIWFDADVLIFDPDHLIVDATDGCAFGYGLMVGVLPDGNPHVGSPGPHNGVIVMTRNHPMLSFYIYAIESIVRNSVPGKLARTAVGPQLLERLTQSVPLECLTSIGWLTPALQMELASGETRLAAIYAQRFGFRLGAADLCHFFRATVPESGRDTYDANVGKAIDCLLETKGEIINRFLLSR